MSSPMDWQPEESRPVSLPSASAPVSTVASVTPLPSITITRATPTAASLARQSEESRPVASSSAPDFVHSNSLLWSRIRRATPSAAAPARQSEESRPVVSSPTPSLARLNSSLSSTIARATPSAAALARQSEESRLIASSSTSGLVRSSSFLSSWNARVTPSAGIVNRQHQEPRRGALPSTPPPSRSTSFLSSRNARVTPSAGLVNQQRQEPRRVSFVRRSPPSRSRWSPFSPRFPSSTRVTPSAAPFDRQNQEPRRVSLSPPRSGFRSPSRPRVPSTNTSTRVTPAAAPFERQSEEPRLALLFQEHARRSPSPGTRITPTATPSDWQGEEPRFVSPSPSPCPVRAYGASITSTRVAPAVTSSDWQSQEPRPAVQFRPIPTSPWDRRDLRNDFFIGRKRKASEMLDQPTLDVEEIRLPMPGAFPEEEVDFLPQGVTTAARTIVNAASYAIGISYTTSRSLLEGGMLRGRRKMQHAVRGAIAVGQGVKRRCVAVFSRRRPTHQQRQLIVRQARQPRRPSPPRGGTPRRPRAPLEVAVPPPQELAAGPADPVTPAAPAPYVDPMDHLRAHYAPPTQGSRGPPQRFSDAAERQETPDAVMVPTISAASTGRPEPYGDDYLIAVQLGLMSPVAQAPPRPYDESNDEYLIAVQLGVTTQAAPLLETPRTVDTPLVETPLQDQLENLISPSQAYVWPAHGALEEIEFEADRSIVSRSTRSRARQDRDAQDAERTQASNRQDHASTELASVAEKANRTRPDQVRQDRVRQERITPASPVIRGLTPEWNTKVDHAMAQHPNKELAWTSTGQPITRADLGTLLPTASTDRTGGWLNDEIINAYLQAIVDYGLDKSKTGRRNADRKTTPRFHAFNSFFYTNIREKGPASVERWTRKAGIAKADLLKAERVFVPVHQGAHWTLLVVSPMERTIEYFDSLGGSPNRFFSTIKNWLKHELGTSWVESEWKTQTPQSPHQANGVDCGVFTVTTAKMILLGINPLAYGQTDIPLQRRRMVAELMNGGFSEAFEP